MASYDPFIEGRFPVQVQTIEAHDPSRDRLFPCEVWSPAAAPAAASPLVLFSHSAGSDRRQSASLCTHLASHGYVVAALDHSERVAAELARKEGETDSEKLARWDALIAHRLPDIRFLLGHMLSSPPGEIKVCPERIGIVGHSFGGWTALAAVLAGDLQAELAARGVDAIAPALT